MSPIAVIEYAPVAMCRGIISDSCFIFPMKPSLSDTVCQTTGFALHRDVAQVNLIVTGSFVTNPLPVT